MNSNASFNSYTSKGKGLQLSLLMLIFLMGIILVSPSIHVYADTSEQRVYDNAGLLSSEEIEVLETTALEIGVKYNSNIYILTDENSNGKSRKQYMEDFADSKKIINSTLIFVNMEDDNRGVEIQGYGDNEYSISNTRIEYILDEVVPYLKSEEYFLAFTTFLEETNYYLEKGPSKDTSNYTPDSNYVSSDKYLQEEADSNLKNSILSELWLQIVISLVIGGIAVGIMAINSGGRVTVNEKTYLDANHSKLIAQRDNYLRTTTTKIRKPSNNTGGGGGGISSGGRTHSGGGRSF